MSTPASGHGHRFKPGLVPTLNDTRMSIQDDGALLIVTTDKQDRTIIGVIMTPSELDNLFNYLQDNVEA